MDISALLARCLTALWEWVVPSYRPELHYMRGPGPASARGKIGVEPEPALPLLRNFRRRRVNAHL
ncbi:hypothetical protein B5V02_33310 [Mesorhizobium kowhaii]|uniref:Uncharacterized protein n=1 Tax=Mesorhizobium kowhaii TaxID=1300272 RepID=A0A2W7BTJ2_9HYPH|nr:hypothetical protein [Mesorhizobium kowhaii]PZV33992.1 hypothetical protein B5V02_33310 [Mesorhizobium kowhaii]